MNYNTRSHFRVSVFDLHDSTSLLFLPYGLQIERIGGFSIMTVLWCLPYTDDAPSRLVLRELLLVTRKGFLARIKS